MVNPRDFYKPIIQSEANTWNIDFKILIAIVEIESNWNQYAVRYEPLWKDFNDPVTHAHRLNITPETEKTMQMMSWGLGQIMGATARDMGFLREMHRISDPATGIELCAIYLGTLTRKYKKTDAIISAYNAGSAVIGMDGKYKNQGYVDKVMSVMKKI